MDWKSILKKVAVGVLIPLLLALLAGAGYGAWYFLVRPTPEKTLQAAIAAARRRDVQSFRATFSSPSLRALEGSWSGGGDNDGAGGGGGGWNAMMAGLLERSGAPPELMEAEINEADTRARVKIRLRGEPQFVSLVRDDSDPAWLRFLKDGGDWRLDVLSGIEAGLSDEARKAQAQEKNEAAANKDKEGAAPTEDFTLEPPKEEGWWKAEEK
jgi:hypothetical protein